jgi:hypothetical protein
MSGWEGGEGVLGCSVIGGMRWYDEEGGENVAKEFHLGGEEELVADLIVLALVVLALFEVAPNGEAVVELVAGELDLLAVVVVLDEADEVARGEPGIVEDFEGALGGEVRAWSWRREISSGSGGDAGGAGFCSRRHWRMWAR